MNLKFEFFNSENLPAVITLINSVIASEVAIPLIRIIPELKTQQIVYTESVKAIHREFGEEIAEGQFQIKDKAKAKEAEVKFKALHDDQFEIKIEPIVLKNSHLESLTKIITPIQVSNLVEIGLFKLD